jgi:hypothetical protein
MPSGKRVERESPTFEAKRGDTKKKKLKMRDEPSLNPEPPASVWLVFETREEGPRGYVGCRYDSGTHCASLVGVYSTEDEAERHADILREADDDDWDEDDPSRQHTVEVIQTSVSTKFDRGCAGVIFGFVANMNLVSPRNCS